MGEEGERLEDWGWWLGAHDKWSAGEVTMEELAASSGYGRTDVSRILNTITMYKKSPQAKEFISRSEHETKLKETAAHYASDIGKYKAKAEELQEKVKEMEKKLKSPSASPGDPSPEVSAMLLQELKEITKLLGQLSEEMAGLSTIVQGRGLSKIVTDEAILKRIEKVKDGDSEILVRRTPEEEAIVQGALAEAEARKRRAEAEKTLLEKAGGFLDKADTIFNNIDKKVDKLTVMFERFMFKGSPELTAEEREKKLGELERNVGKAENEKASGKFRFKVAE